MKILFVCTGNICRSPMAAAIARDALDRAGRFDVEVASAGTFALDGHVPTSDAELAAEAHGLSLDGHRAQQLTRELVEEADLVVGMEREHADYARQLGARRVVTLARPIRDPYGRGADVYRETWTLLAEQLPDVLDELEP
jgi:protein-tyrosine-phosphatase